VKHIREVALVVTELPHKGAATAPISKESRGLAVGSKVAILSHTTELLSLLHSSLNWNAYGRYNHALLYFTQNYQAVKVTFI
jgi:hypothetical protein